MSKTVLISVLATMLLSAVVQDAASQQQEERNDDIPHFLFGREYPAASTVQVIGDQLWVGEDLVWPRMQDNKTRPRIMTPEERASMANSPRSMVIRYVVEKFDCSAISEAETLLLDELLELLQEKDSTVSTVVAKESSLLVNWEDGFTFMHMPCSQPIVFDSPKHESPNWASRIAAQILEARDSKRMYVSAIPRPGSKMVMQCTVPARNKRLYEAALSELRHAIQDGPEWVEANYSDGSVIPLRILIAFSANAYGVER